jgi:hypothetical protein
MRGLYRLAQYRHLNANTFAKHHHIESNCRNIRRNDDISLRSRNAVTTMQQVLPSKLYPAWQHCSRIVISPNYTTTSRKHITMIENFEKSKINYNIAVTSDRNIIANQPQKKNF